MDKKNTTIGVLLLLAAFAIIYLAPKSTPSTKPENAPAVATGNPPGATPATSVEGAPAPAAAATTVNGTFAAVAKESTNATLTTLSNEFIEARLTDFGGAVLEVAFKKYPAEEGKPAPYVFNQLHEDPLLAIGEFPGIGHTTRYELVSKSATEVVYRTVFEGKIEVTRTYRLTDPAKPGGDPYRLQHETTFRNLTGGTIPLPRATLGLGTASLLNQRDSGQYLSVTTYDGDSPNYTERGELEGGGIGSLVGSPRAAKLILEKPGSVVWAGVKNQFFTAIYTPDKPGIATIAKRIDLTQVAPFPDPNRPNIGMTGAARFDLAALPANGTEKLSGMLYVGPQEYRRLARFEHKEDRVLPYTQYFFNRIFFSRYVAPLQNVLLNFTHSLVGNWGVAVILMTLILKTISLPFTLAASRSAKRMAKIQPELQAIREKYKDNPQKQQAATMELFKSRKINPVGGCIPVLITMPLFIGFFAMLQCTAELRFQHFLWARDLSAPDTIAHLFGIPINIMPLLMGATMFMQMHLTPTPSVDNMQMKMMKFMPVMFTFFCYQFSCALSLYSTINGLFTIGQQLVINRMKDPSDAGPAGPGTAAASTIAGWKKGTKNVTPPKK